MGADVPPVSTDVVVKIRGSVVFGAPVAVAKLTATDEITPDWPASPTGPCVPAFPTGPRSPAAPTGPRGPAGPPFAWLLKYWTTQSCEAGLVDACPIVVAAVKRSAAWHDDFKNNK